MKTVLVTGGASGLGAAVMREMGEQGVSFDLREPTAAVDHELLDLADSAAVAGAVERVAWRRGSIDAVVTAAGIDACGPLGEVAWDAWQRVVAVNLLGTVSIIRAALPHLRQSGGRVVTVASTLGLRPLPHATAYCASKFGVVGFTRSLAAELAGEIGVTLLVPGGMNTAFFDDRDPEYHPGPDAELNDPANVARAVVFALSQPVGCELRELVITPSTEPSWP